MRDEKRGVRGEGGEEEVGGTFSREDPTPHPGYTLPGVLEALKLQLSCWAVSQWALLAGGPWERHIAQIASEWLI